jgi:hypothetical protein
MDLEHPLSLGLAHYPPMFKILVEPTSEPIKALSTKLLVNGLDEECSFVVVIPGEFKTCCVVETLCSLLQPPPVLPLAMVPVGLLNLRI